MSKSALVTGAAGFIGRHLVQQLLEAGWDVTGYDLSAKPNELDLDWIEGDIRNADSLAEAMKDKHTVFHLAAYAHLFAQDTSIYDRINRRGTLLLLQQALAAGVSRIVATSSAVILSGYGAGGTVNEARPRPALEEMAGPYSRSKWQADLALGANWLDVVRLYPTVPLGPGDYAMTAPTQMLQSFMTAPPPAYLDTTLNFVPVQDVARAHVLAAEKGEAGDRFLVSGEDWNMQALLEAIEAETGTSIPRKTIPYWLARTAAGLAEPLARLRRRNSLATVEGVRLAKASPRFDASLAQDKLGWQASDTHQALHETLRWLRARSTD